MGRYAKLTVAFFGSVFERVLCSVKPERFGQVGTTRRGIDWHLLMHVARTQ
jgi:hypothetical protein